MKEKNNINYVDDVQEVIGYYFVNPFYLDQAFTRKSYSQERGGYDNEILELIGDRVLDLFVTKIISDKYGYIDEGIRGVTNFSYLDDKKRYGYFGVNKYNTEGKISEIKQKLVNKDMLSHRIDALDLNKYLIMGKGDINTNQQDEKSVKEDLFEAILGAVAIDSKWNFKVLEEVVSTLLNIDYYLSDEFKGYDKDNVTLLQQWCQKSRKPVPDYEYDEITQEDFICKLYFSINENTNRYFEGKGRSKGEARRKCAKEAYKYLEENNLLFTVRDEVPDKITIENAIQSLNKLHAKGYIKSPIYEQKEEPTFDENGNPIWKCSCSMPETFSTATVYTSSKKSAKQYAAYVALCYYFDILDEYEYGYGFKKEFSYKLNW